MADPPSPRFVLDASVALAWCFQDEADPYADAIAARFPSVEAVVPNLWHLEIANIFISGERRGRCTPTDAAAWFGFLGNLPIAVDDQTSAEAWHETTRLARAYNLSAYDAAYLELALRLAVPLATLDQRLDVAARAAGVARFTP